MARLRAHDRTIWTKRGDQGQIALRADERPPATVATAPPWPSPSIPDGPPASPTARRPGRAAGRHAPAGPRADGPVGSAGRRTAARPRRYAHPRQRLQRWPRSDSHGSARSGQASAGPRRSAADRRACLWWPRRSGHRWYTDSAALFGYARECSPAPPVL
jgi:hypothetical protein